MNTYQKRYYKKYREAILKKKKVYFLKNREKVRFLQKKWRDNNPDKLKLYREKNKEKQAIYYKKWYEQNGRKRSVKQIQQIHKWSKNHPIEVKARNLLGSAIRSRKIKKPKDCSICKKNKKHIIGHHTDYNKPLDVKWVCSSCHKKIRHKKIHFSLNKHTNQ